MIYPIVLKLNKASFITRAEQKYTVKLKTLLILHVFGISKPKTS